MGTGTLYWLFNGGPLTPLRGLLSGSLTSLAGSLDGFAGSLDGSALS
jgi:hypothetical protein